MFYLFSQLKPLRKSQVVAVVEIIRHGARTPMTFKEHSAKLYFGSRIAQLTINGLRQHILAGRWLRKRYVYGEVSRLFDPDIAKLNVTEIEVISSPLQRTIFSSTGHINGLFPKAITRLSFQDRHQIRTNDVPPILGYKADPRDGKEITIKVISKEKDFVFHADKCEREESNGKNIFQEMNKTSLFNVTVSERESALNDIMTQYEKILKDKIEKVQKKDEKEGTKIKKELEKVKEYSKLHLKKLISWLRPFRYHTNIPQLLKPSTEVTMKKQILNRWYEPRLFDSEALKYTSSYIFREIYNLFYGKYRQTDKRKMLIFTGHDTNIVNALANLLETKFLRKKIFTAPTNNENYKFLVPPLASSLLFELHKVHAKKDYFVKIIYNGQYLTKNFKRFVQVKNFNELKFRDFMSLLKSRTVTAVDELKCGQPFK